MGLGDGIKKIFTKIKNAIFLDKKELDEIIKDFQKVLIESDVDVELVSEISKNIKKKFLETELKNIEKKEMLIKLIYDEIVNILGEKKHELEIKKNDKVLLIGLYGSGKTTTSVKLAYYYSKKGLKTCVISLDVHRPAAQEQLEQFAAKAGIKAFINKEEKDPLKIWKNFEDQLKKFDVIFIDSAGRDALNEELIKEIKDICELIKPEHILLIIPADIGQAARKQAEFFNKAIKIDGAILTRMDGTAKAGGALASCKVANCKVYFIGVGEKFNDIELFDPKRYVSRILGLGDLDSLIEKIKLSLGEEKIEIKKEDKFTLVDFYNQILAIQKIGPFKKIIELIPGMGNINIPSSLLDIQEKKIKHWKYAIDSMTKEERENPEILDSSRIARISKGSHVPINEIKEMLKNYKIIKEFIGKEIDEKKITKLAKRFRII
ncbi:MAG: signal recognition particle receptor subunit alpha [Candidatus Pacearchaeota archaeon]